MDLQEGLQSSGGQSCRQCGHHSVPVPDQARRPEFDGFCSFDGQRVARDSAIVLAMNFLAHLWLAGNDEGLRLGAMLGDFIRGGVDGLDLPEPVREGILLHRFTDQYVDRMPMVARMRKTFPTPFRRYSGIVLDLAFDHELARRWPEFCSQPLEEFDREVRGLLNRNETLLPDDLKHFMDYADLRGLFAAYRHEAEILHSLSGIGIRLSRPNPLHRVEEIWPDLQPGFREGFDTVFSQVRDGVFDWLSRFRRRRHSA